MKPLAIVGLIWLGCAIAWMILGTTIDQRSGGSSLLPQVHLLWGPPMQQQPPRASCSKTVRERKQIIDETGRNAAPQSSTEEHEVTTDVPLAHSDIAVRLDLEHRKKGLFWFPTYAVELHARYGFVNTTATACRLDASLPLSSENTVYDGLEVLDQAGRPVASSIASGTLAWSDDFAPGQRREYQIAYRSRGTSSWAYQLAAGTGRVRDFHLALDTNFAAVDFPPGTLSPTTHASTGRGWHGDWSFQQLVANASIGIALPEKPSPGPLASRITFFAPVSLLFFFFVVAVLAVAQQRAIHPLNYFFFGCAFFAFHLLFGYLVDHLSLAPSFAIAALTSLVLQVTYARLFVGWRFALREMGLAQLVYLVLFSFTFFWTGFTGLAITIGAVLTLAVMMQLTGRTRWGRTPALGAPSASVASASPTIGSVEPLVRGTPAG